ALALVALVAGTIYQQQREKVLELEMKSRKEATEREQAEKQLRAQADQARTEAEHQKERAEGLLYLNRVLLASGEWRDNRVARADELLRACPAELRRWEWHYLYRLCHGELRTLRGHRGWVHVVRFSPDGLLLASGGTSNPRGDPGQGEVKLWDAASGA